jgi:hypothetical protein
MLLTKVLNFSYRGSKNIKFNHLSNLSVLQTKLEKEYFYIR